MCSFLLTTKDIKDQTKVNFYLQRRGPDHTECAKVDRYTIIHNLLSITGNFQNQPFIKGNIAAFFNGEIYNYDKFGNYSSDGACILDLYEKHGEDFVRLLDGEYAVCILDLDKDTIIFATDIFKTKPLWYSVGDDIGLSSYKSALESLGHTDIIKAKPNTIYTYNITTKELKEQTNYHFDLKQHKTHYDDWIKAFEAAIEKRTKNVREKVFIGLSSGHDSGIIFSEMLKQKVDFKAYSITGEESMEVLTKRHELHNDSMMLENDKTNFLKVLKHITRYCEKYSDPHYDILKDEASSGLALICTHAVSEGRKIFLSGAGADEIISDYGFNGIKLGGNSEFGGYFPEDLSEIFPWRNFFYGSQECYLAKEEHICGCYGIEARYPFLDKDVVQEFLWLTADLKRQNYKAPIHEYFVRNNFPYTKEKIGFYFFKQNNA